MGITGFYQYLQENVQGAFSTINNSNINNLFIDHIYIDLNYLLHQCSYNSDTIDLTIKKVITMIEDLCAKINPLCTLNLCADGSAPLAKILLQRERRLTEVRTNSSDFVLNFTPGSEFMNNLHLKLDETKRKLENLYAIKISIHNLDVGEAEIKIKNLILQNLSNNEFSTHLAYTNDADVLLIMALTKMYNNIYILIRSKELQLVWLKKIIDLTNFNALDFGFLNLFLGNDYLPKLKLVSQDKLWTAYRLLKSKYGNLVSTVTQHNKEYLIINDQFLKRILTYVIGLTNIAMVKKSKLKLYDHDLICTYLEGIMWCANMYFNGKCIDNQYMYESQIAIDPVHLLLFLNFKSINSTFNSRETKAISNDLCSIILLPYSAKKFVNPKYYKFMDDNMHLYAEEQCGKCIDFYKNNKKIDKDESGYKEYMEKRKTFLIHKNSHAKLLRCDIEELQDKIIKILDN